MLLLQPTAENAMRTLETLVGAFGKLVYLGTEKDEGILFRHFFLLMFPDGLVGASDVALENLGFVQVRYLEDDCVRILFADETKNPLKEPDIYARQIANRLVTGLSPQLDAVLEEYLSAE